MTTATTRRAAQSPRLARFNPTREAITRRAEDRRNMRDRGHFRAFCMAHDVIDYGNPQPLTDREELLLRGLRDAYPRAYNNAIESRHSQHFDY